MPEWFLMEKIVFLKSIFAKRFHPFPFLSLLLGVFLGGAHVALGQIVEKDLGIQNAAAALVVPLMGPGISASNVTYQGLGSSAGSFTGGTSVVGFDSGIVLSTGSAAQVAGSAPATASTCNSLPGDPDLALLSGNSPADLYDSTVLSFDFIPSFGTITFKYVFASEEYNQYVGSNYNDVFGFFVNGTNVALVPGTSTNVSINNINDCTNTAYFIDNIGSPQGGSCPIVKSPAGLNTTMNGLTTVLTVNAVVNPGVVNHIKLAISDVGDCRNDSNVFIQFNSFSSGFTSTFTPTPTPTDTPCGWPGNTCTPTITWTPTKTATPGPTDTPCGLPGNTCTFTPTDTYTPTSTHTPTPSYTTTADIRPSNTFTAAFTPTITFTSTATFTATASPTKTSTATPTNSPTRTFTPTSTFSPTATPTPTDTLTPCGFPGNTCTPSPTPASVDIFTLDRNLFNPAVDKVVSMDVGYSSYPGNYSLRIYNTAGEHIQTLVSRRVNGPIHDHWTWDGTNKAGDPCASGVYVIYLVEPYSKKVKRLLLIR